MGPGIKDYITGYHACFVFILLFEFGFRSIASTTNNIDKAAIRDEVVEMFDHAYSSYMENAYPADELMPLSCKGRIRGQEPSRGDIDDLLGKYSLTIVDSLDTLALLGKFAQFEQAVRLIIKDVSFDTDIVVSVFETNIRMLGGLLGGHVMALEIKERGKYMQWYNNELLTFGKELGERLLPAFNTTTGMPYPRVNLRHGLGKGRSERDTCTACAGTILLEFAALSRLTGDPIFEAKAKHAMHELWTRRQRVSNLVGTTINIHTGDWVRRDSGVGAGIDSYYEYLLKGYILLGDDVYLERFNVHYEAVMRYISDGPWLLDVHMHKPQTRTRSFMDSLQAFWPGLQVLAGDIAPAIKTHELLYQVIQKHKFLPEAFTSDLEVYWAQHPLRPELIESTYLLYQATHDPYYLEIGQQIVNNLQEHARVPCGFAGIKDVRTGSHEDRMDSFFLAETFKYLYLLFSEPEDLAIPIEDYLFTTEAHLLPLTLSKICLGNDTSDLDDEDKQTDSSKDDESKMSAEKSCPNHNFHYPTTGRSFAEAIREPLRRQAEEGACPSTIGVSKSSITDGRLRASDFIPGNGAHMEELKKMGIRLITLKDGRVQLMHSASQAATPNDAEQGMLFMQEMIELSKTQSPEVEYQPRVVQFITPPFLGNMVLAAGPAQFGYDLSNNQGVVGEVMIAQPYHACTELVNESAIKGKIVLMVRGECMFVDKARKIQAAGAAGGIVVDSTEGSSSDTAQVFAMSGDGTNDVTIPMVFLFHKEGQILHDAVAERPGVIQVMLLDKAKSDAELKEYFKSKLEASATDMSSNPPRQPIIKEDAPYEVNVPGLKPQDDQDNDDTAAKLLAAIKKNNQQLFQADLNVEGFLDQLVIKDGKLYLNNPSDKAGKASDLQDGKVFLSSIDLQGMQLQYDNIMQQYLQTPNGKEYQTARADSALKHGIDAYSNGPPSDQIPSEADKDKQNQVNEILQQIHKEFMNLESLRLAFDHQVNPISADDIHSNADLGSEKISEQDSIDNFKKGLNHLSTAGSMPPVEEIAEHRTPLDSSSSNADPSSSSRTNLPTDNLAIQPQEGGSIPSGTAARGSGSGINVGGGSANTDQSMAADSAKPAGGHIGGTAEQLQQQQQDIINAMKLQQEQQGHQQQLLAQQELLQRQFQRHQQLMDQAAKNQAAAADSHSEKEDTEGQR